MTGFRTVPTLGLLSLVVTVVTLTSSALAQTDLPLRSRDHRPRFDLPLRYRVVEELPVGTAIADLVVDAGLKRKYGPEVLSELEYRLLQDPVAVPLGVGLKTGLLTTVGRIDRDELAACRDKTTCELTIDVTVRPARYFQVVKVTIEIVDVNDNEPRFRGDYHSMTSPTIVVDVRESASPGTTFALPVAIDADGPEFSVRTYELIELTSTSFSSRQTGSDVLGGGLFALDIIARPHDQLEPRLVVRQSPDRERRAEHRFRLIAYDGGRPPKSGSVDIDIRVLDSNDNSPIFDSSGPGYEANVSESVSPGTQIVRVRATDADEGLNGEIWYRMSAQTLSTYGSVFAIDNRTGDISVVGQLDRERHSVYQLTVIAQDLGPDSMPVDAAVVVRVIDVNDNAPVIAVNTLQRSPAGTRRPGTDQSTADTRSSTAAVIVAEVPENLAAGTFVGHVSVTDDDGGEFGRVDCNMTESSAFSLIRRGRSSTEYQILTAQPLDREHRDRYDPVITCWDGGRPPMTATVRLTVRVSDTNDNRPRFGQPSYTTRVAENSPPGTVVLRLAATDLDIGINADLHYVLASSSTDMTTGNSATGNSGIAATATGREGPFRIDPDDGTITVSGSGMQSPIDRERYSSFSFAVLAVDHGVGQSLTGSTVVVVTVDDVNDEFPVFSTNRFAFSVDENRPEAEVVGAVSALDSDATRPNNMVGYRLQFDDERSTGITDDATRFAIEPETGIIHTTTPLDREHREVYQFSVIAFDRGRPSLSSTAKVEVRVRDVNDNAPIFDDESIHEDDDDNTQSSAAVVVVSGSAPTGSSVTRVSARDADDSDNARIKYQIVAQRRRRLPDSESVQSSSSEEDDFDLLDERFSINPDTGDLVVAAPFPELSRHGGVGGVETLDFVVTIRATDGGVPVRWTETDIRMVVNASVPYVLPDGASPVARWKPEASSSSRQHVTVVACVVAASTLATVVLLILIAVVRLRHRRKSRRDRRRRPSPEDVRERLTEARRALTAGETSPVSAVNREDSLGLPTAVFCCDELARVTPETMPLKAAKFDSGSRCSSPYSRPPASMTPRTASRNGNRFVVGGCCQEFATPVGCDASVMCERHKATTTSTPLVQPVISAAAAGGENERDSQHSSGEASNADSGRGHSSCCGDESTDEPSFISCRSLHHHHPPHPGAVTPGTCCVAGPTSRMIHYLPPPPPPRLASYCVSSAATLQQPSLRGATGHHPGWSTMAGFKSGGGVLPAHDEAAECLRPVNHRPVTSDSSVPMRTQSPLSFWTTGDRRQQPTTSPTTTTPAGNTENSSTPDTDTGRQQQTGNGISVVWNSNKSGVVV